VYRHQDKEAWNSRRLSAPWWCWRGTLLDKPEVRRELRLIYDEVFKSNLDGWKSWQVSSNPSGWRSLESEQEIDRAP